MSHAKTAWVDFKEIKARASIVQILERYGALASLSKSGNGDRLSGACPIHGGTNKTHFRVSVSKNCWNCFGKCQSGGNVIDFVAKKEDITFRDAALLVDEWFPGGPNREPDKPERPRFDTSQVKEVPRVDVVAAPPEPESEKAEEDQTPNKPLSFALTKLDATHPYLVERGLSSETIATFGLGFCSKGLLRGYTAIPIHNTQGELVAYAGRWPGSPETGNGKYKLPEGFKKSIEIFNYHRAIASEHESPLVVVEGFFGAMSIYQAGYERVVAIMGSSLSQKQEEMLCRLCETPDERIILFLDGNAAGRKGQADALQRLSKRLYVRAIDLGNATTQPEHIPPEELRDILPFP
jgi:DNA primase